MIERRDDGRAKHADPLDAFTDALVVLGYAPFRLWWQQLTSELRRHDSNFSPVSVCVLSAALVEGCLALAVTHSRSIGSATLASTDFARPPTTWKIDDLIKSAAAGRDDAILSDAQRKRAEALIVTRQRIHAGRMLSDYPGGPPDLRPEEAREAKAVAEMVVRAVLDWLAQHKPAGEAITAS